MKLWRMIASIVLFALALLTLGCSSPTAQPALEQRSVAAVYEGWYAASPELPELPELDEKHWRADLFEVRFPVADEFNRLCSPATVTTAWACFRWLLVRHEWGQGIRESISKPVAVLRPNIPPELVEGLAIHELLHGAVYRVLDRPRADPYDYHHTDVRVWGGGRPSAEALARESLEPGVQALEVARATQHCRLGR